MSESLKWPDEFASHTPKVTFGRDFVALLEEQVSLGTIVKADEEWASFSFERDGRSVCFVRRGRISAQRLECWEVGLSDQHVPVSLGSLFGISESAWVVTSGLENIRIIVQLWLERADAQAIMNSVPLWDKMNAWQPLKPP